ncbi:MAG TPA: hypothetical protein VHB20_01435, partial [Verrucomicrobiae bacterium]|nr:hypothetical protein [Verrucomicrobiae bacterium]
MNESKPFPHNNFPSLWPGLRQACVRFMPALAALCLGGASAWAVPPGNVVLNAGDSGADSLRAVIAGATNGATITFTGSLNGQTIVLASEILVNKNLTIQGPGAANLTISGNNATRVFHVQSANVSLNGLTVANGKVTGGNGSVGNGGGGGGGAMGAGLLADAGSTVLVQDMVFANNSVRGGNGGGNTGSGSGAAGGAGKGGSSGALAQPGQGGYQNSGGAAGSGEGGGGGGSGSGVGAASPGGNGSFGGGGGGGGG